MIQKYIVADLSQKNTLQGKKEAIYVVTQFRVSE